MDIADDLNALVRIMRSFIDYPPAVPHIVAATGKQMVLIADIIRAVFIDVVGLCPIKNSFDPDIIIHFIDRDSDRLLVVEEILDCYDPGPVLIL